jgi:hypothetical protein
LDYGQVNYLRGDGVQVEVEHEIQVSEGGSFLKIYAVNDDWFPHAIDVDVEIEVEEDREE